MERDFLFCSVCGTLLTFDSIRYASCPLCGFKRRAKELEGKETRYTITAEDIRRELKIQPFVILGSTPVKETVARKNPVMHKPCPRCDKEEAEYYQLQTRSADEAATTYYECTNIECGHKWSE
ncbi:hypothetical protein BS78_01G106900 [Paspalum vaginatum]|nr:hypothetical protein BS78_01G106900 [Paspalum vaginatum]